MSHAAQFSMDPDLSATFEAQYTTADRIRALKVTIVDEKFLLSKSVAWLPDAEAPEAFGAAKNALLAKKEACYMLFRAQSDGTWLLATFVPEDESVRNKMLYSSGRATLKAALGGGDRIGAELHWCARAAAYN